MSRLLRKLFLWVFHKDFQPQINIQRKLFLRHLRMDFQPVGMKHHLPYVRESFWHSEIIALISKVSWDIFTFSKDHQSWKNPRDVCRISKMYKVVVVKLVNSSLLM